MSDYRSLLQARADALLTEGFAATHSRHHGEPTSYEAATEIAQRANAQMWQVVWSLEEHGPQTADELDQRLGWRPTTAGRRIPDAIRAGLVEWADQTRKTRSGRRANVYRVKVNKQGEAA